MLTMDQINNIRFLKRTQGKTYKEVGEITGVSYKTIKKYEELEDLTPKIRPYIKRPTKLDPFKKEIRKWLVSDKGRLINKDILLREFIIDFLKSTMICILQAIELSRNM